MPLIPEKLSRFSKQVLIRRLSFANRYPIFIHANEIFIENDRLYCFCLPNCNVSATDNPAGKYPPDWQASVPGAALFSLDKN